MDKNSDNSSIETFSDDDISVNSAPRPAYAPPAHDSGKRKRNWRVIYIIVMCFCVVPIISSFWSYGQFTPSTHERTALAPGAAHEARYYTDETGWIDDDSKLVKGLIKFHESTGVAPYVYIIDSLNGSSPTAQQLDDFTDDLYGELLLGEAHMLLVLLPTANSFMDSYASGTLAAAVIDAEAKNILHDYLKTYYSYDSYTNSQILSEAFDSAAQRIMHVTYSPWIAFFVFGGGAALATFLFIRWRKKQRKAQDDLTAQEVEELLKIPLERFGDPEVEELAKKYEDPV